MAYFLGIHDIGNPMINVLLVDDSKFVVHAMQSILEELNYQIAGVAHDGLQAIEKHRDCGPDVTLLDITMPNMDGLECLCRIKEESPQARVIMLSAVQDPETIEKCLASGAAGFLQKPIRKGNLEDLDRLCAAIENAVGRTI